MGLNDTLDRLAREREKKESLAADTGGQVMELAEKIFFQRMLKDINPGMSEAKIDALIDRSIMIATRLHDRLHGF